MTCVPRVVVAAPSSGHGKTAVAIGLLAAFAARGLRPAGFKIGPDFVDAAYLGLAAGRVGRNLDPQLVGSERIAPLLAHGAAGADVAVIEGTMGLYDGLSGQTDVVSTAQVAGHLGAPVVLVVDVAAMGQSVAALVHGFRAYDEVVWLAGVILNRVASDRHEALLRESLDDIGVPVMGVLRRPDLGGTGPAALPARAHGAVPVAGRDPAAARAVRRLGETVAATVDVEGILGLARSAPALAVEPWSAAAEVAAVASGRAGADGGAPAAGPRPVVALAGGPGLSYGYEEAREMLAAAGAEPVVVDPLRDETLPEGTAALVVGAGLPETYLDDLSANRRLGADVAALAHRGGPIVAEGAGLVWLCREHDGRPMCGVVDAVAHATDVLVIGYRHATARVNSPVAEPGGRVVGHKYHRTQVAPRAGTPAAWTWPGGRPEGFVWRNVHASYLSLHWAGVPEIATRLVSAASAPARVSAAAPAAANEGRAA